MSLTAELGSFKANGQKKEMTEDFKFVLTYGFGFITMMFLGFFSGFVFGRQVLLWDQDKSLILSLVVGISTIIVEAGLMIYRIHKMEVMREMSQKKSQFEVNMLANLDKIKTKNEVLRSKKVVPQELEPMKSKKAKKND